MDNFNKKVQDVRKVENICTINQASSSSLNFSSENLDELKIEKFYSKNQVVINTDNYPNSKDFIVDGNKNNDEDLICNIKQISMDSIFNDFLFSEFNLSYSNDEFNLELVLDNEINDSK